MGNFQTTEQKHRHIRKIIDKVFTNFTAGSGEDTLSFHDLYIAVLIVYNDINKKVPGPHYDPPTREQVHKLFEEFDTNADGKLDRSEFAAFLQQFTKNISGDVGKGLLIYAGAPILAFAVKRATEQIPRVGPVVKRIPNFVYAALVSTAVTLLGHQKALESDE